MIRMNFDRQLFKEAFKAGYKKAKQINELYYKTYFNGNGEIPVGRSINELKHECVFSMIRIIKYVLNKKSPNGHYPYSRIKNETLKEHIEKFWDSALNFIIKHRNDFRYEISTEVYLLDDNEIKEIINEHKNFIIKRIIKEKQNRTWFEYSD